MSERGPKGLGSYRVVKRTDGSLALKMKITRNGKYYSKQIDAPPKRKIEEARAAFVTEVSSGAFDKVKVERKKLTGQPTLTAFADVFLASHVSLDPDRAATRAAYGKMLRIYILPAIGAHKLSEITTPMVREAIQDLFRSGRAMGTVKLAFAVLHRCFDAAIEDGLLRENPAPKFSKLHLGQGEDTKEIARRHALSGPQVAALLDACGNDGSLRLFIAIMASCGLRPGEANGLLWQDVDLKTGTLRVRGSAKKIHDKTAGTPSRTWIGKTKTPSSRRDVTMGPVLTALFVAERQRQEGVQRELLGLAANVVTAKPLLAGDACVFCADVSTAEGLRSPRGPDTLRWNFKQAASRAGLSRGVSPHWLRHTAISHAIAQGTALADASKRAGHANPGITAAIYTHAIGEGEKQAAAIGDSLLEPGSAAHQTKIGSNRGPD